ncbi:MAG: hypothetical protein VR64_21360 [Desulfatitalea sp. BRH_c12]|nr:MAG: hypothetical protein VR64_21360 [Desulfatitalea sp. BRH_c12]
MAKSLKRKGKVKITQSLTEFYQLAVQDWEVYYHFGITPKRLRDSKGPYWEISKLKLSCGISSPKLRSASNAKVELSADPRQEDNWESEPTIVSAEAIGFMEIPRGQDVLLLYCSVPPRLGNNIHAAVAAGKIEHILVHGDKLKWRQGKVYSLSLSTKPEEFE